MKATHNAGRITSAQHMQLRLLAARLGRKKNSLVAEAVETLLADRLTPSDIDAPDAQSATHEAGKITAGLNAALKERAIWLACRKEALTANAIIYLLTYYRDRLE